MKTFHDSPEFKELLKQIREQDICESEVVEVIETKYAFKDRKLILEKMATSQSLKITDFDDEEAIFQVHDVLGKILCEAVVTMDFLYIETKTHEEMTVSIKFIEDILGDEIIFVSTAVVDINELI